MFIEVNKIAPDGMQIDRAVPLPPLLQPGGEAAPLTGVRLVGRFARLRDDFEFLGRVEATVSLTCSRCLASFPHSVAGACHRIFRRGTLARTRAEGDLEEEDLALTPFEGERIDLVELVQEQVYLLLPLKPICREDCAGICPRCGANRNTGSCGCSEGGREPEALTSKLPL